MRKRGIITKRPLKETSLPHRTNLYKRGKLASDNIILEDAENTTENAKVSKRNYNAH